MHTVEETPSGYRVGSASFLYRHRAERCAEVRNAADKWLTDHAGDLGDLNEMRRLVLRGVIEGANHATRERPYAPIILPTHAGRYGALPAVGIDDVTGTQPGGLRIVAITEHGLDVIHAENRKSVHWSWWVMKRDLRRIAGPVEGVDYRARTPEEQRARGRALGGA